MTQLYHSLKTPGKHITGAPAHLGVTAVPFMTGKHRTSLGSQQHGLRSGNGTCIHEGVPLRPEERQVICRKTAELGMIGLSD